MQEPFLGYCPNNVVKKIKNKICIVRFQFYCNLKGVVGWFVLQGEEYCKKKGLCIAIQSVYCKWEGLEWLLKKIVLQYNYCIAGWKVAWPEGDVVSQYKKCIVTEIWPRGLCCKRRLRVYCRKIVLQ